MITQEQIDSLKAGEKLIFFRDGGVLSTNQGNVFTFANWWNEDDKWRPGKHWWQCQELHNLGNHEHNFSIYDTELFDENIHKEFVLMDEKKLASQKQEFIRKHGGGVIAPNVMFRATKIILLLVLFALAACKEPYVIVLANKNATTKKTTYCAEQFGTGNSACWESTEDYKTGDIVPAKRIKRHY